MSFNAGAITSTLGLDVSPFARGFMEANAIMSVFPQSVTNFLANPLLGVIGLAKQAASALSNLVSSGIKGFASMELTQMSMEVMLGSADRAKKLLGDLRQLGMDTPFAFPELAGAAQKLLAFNVPAEKIITTLTNIGNIASGIRQPIGEIADIYGKAQVQGRLFGEDINQLTGRGIPIIQELAKQFGVAESSVKDLVEKGSVNFSNLEKAFESLNGTGGKFSGLMERQSKTLIGVWSNFKDQVDTTFQEIGGSIVQNLNLKQLIQDLGPQIGKLMEVLAPVGEAIMGGIVAGFKLLSDIGPGLMELLKGIASIVGPVLTPVFKVLGEVLEPVAKLLGAIAEAIGKILGGIGAAIKGVTDYLGITSGDEVGVGTTSQPAAKTTVTVQNVNVAAIDTKEASSQMAAKIQTPLQEGLRREGSKLQGAARSQFVVRYL